MNAHPTALVLGGTQFLGIHLVNSLISEGWEVTLFNRGVTNPKLFPSLTLLQGDRDGDVSALANHEWDVVYDLSALHPTQVTRSAEHLAGSCDHYIYISTISAYAALSEKGATEETPLAKLDGPVPDEVDGESYGALKALCEQQVTELFDNTTIVRPAIIVGPDDPTDRFAYWVSRVSTPGPHVVPPVPTSSLQYVDVRDLSAWLVHLGATRQRGIFNAATDPMPFIDFLHLVAEVGETKLRPVLLYKEQVIAERVLPWGDLPMWMPPEYLPMRAFFDVDSSLAVEAGLRNRPVRETIQDTLTWVRARGTEQLRCGLSPEREAELVAKYGQDA